MNQQQTVEKMRQLRLYGMADMHYKNIKEGLGSDYTLDEYIAILVDREWEERENNRIQRYIKQARFKISASVQDIDYKASRNLDRNVLERLLQLDFVRRKENIIITEPTGVGKSYIAQAIGIHACNYSFKTLYFNTARLFNQLKLNKLDGTYLKELKKLENTSLLILDDFGLQAFDNHMREALLNVIEDRFNKNSLIVTSQIPISKWYKVIGEGTIADAILDRLINSSHRIELDGESLRKNMFNTD